MRFGYGGFYGVKKRGDESRKVMREKKLERLKRVLMNLFLSIPKTFFLLVKKKKRMLIGGCPLPCIT